LNIASSKLSQFSFATGHDLKESLRNITSFTQLASIELAENPPQAQVHLQEAATSGKRMRKMLDDLLHYSNLGGNDTVISRFPLDEAISSVKQQLKTEIEEARGDVLLTTPATLKANRTEVEQIFFNLVHNAIRYQSPDREPRITIKLEDREQQLVFIVCDNGMGVPIDHQKNIFKPFFRLHNRSKSGSGLGLSICKTIIESYDGKIWYEAANDNGSCFCFTLPKSEPKAQLNPNLFIP
ncbi:MAG: sensor histidine kinase, partial [Lewinella sp.]|uniref:sensor histidine kinase n=1 Tax=Lewinella sp. TaxID=2004506 RepID=UPI003D6BE2EB